MKIYEEMIKRNIIAQVTGEEKIQNMLDNEKITFYVGCDPTADSLHVGHFVQFMVISRLQQCGHHPIFLFGGGTALLGDPSGRNDMRKMLSKDEIAHNVDCFKKQASKFLDMSDVTFVNNADWLCSLNHIDFLRDIGKFFNVNKMLTYECYKRRLEDGLTFLELNYMIMQSYDFLHLHEKYGCILQIGGNDQWSNIISGVDLVRKKTGDEVFGMTSNLLVKSDGTKMGKTSGGAIWLNAEKTSPYDFYQYWRNVGDDDVINCMKMLSSIDLAEINEYAEFSGKKINEVKETLAFHLTEKVHGTSEAVRAQNAARSVFVSDNANEDIPTKHVSFDGDEISIIDLLLNTAIVPSKSEARRLILQNGISIDGKTASIGDKIKKSTLNNGILLKKGKKFVTRIKCIPFLSGQQ